MSRTEQSQGVRKTEELDRTRSLKIYKTKLHPLRYHYDALVVVARFQVNTCSIHYVCGGE